MIELERLFSTDGFMPHGMCYMWRPAILAVHVGADSFIALAYFTIPFTLLYFVRKRAEPSFTWIFLSFAIFIVACGVSHVMEIWTIWFPMYWLSGGIKVITALASVMTAILLVRLVPAALRFPTPSVLQAANEDLAREVADRKRAEHNVLQTNASLEARVADRTQQLAAANHRLTQINARFAIASKAARLGFWDFDPASDTFEWDDSMFELYGRPRLGGAQPYALWATIVHPDDRELSERTLMKSRDAAVALESDFRVVHPSGDIRHLRSAFWKAPDLEGHTERILGVTFDVTEGKQADERFRLALEAAPTGMLVIDEAGTIVLVNAQIEALFGYRRNELLGKRLEMLVPERYRAHQPDLRQMLSGDPKTRLMGADRELYGLRQDGSEVPIEIELNPLQTSEGRCVLTSIADLTDRKRASAAQQRMTALVESSSDAILTEDLDGNIRSWNPAAKDLLGYTAKEIVGQSVRCLIPADRQDEESDILTRVKDGQRVANFETLRLRKDGSSVDVSLTISPVYGDAGQVVYASKIMRDITQQKFAAEALRTVNAQLELRIKTRTAELRERESLLQEVHHRVKNNLHVISSLINMQIRGLKDKSSQAILRECQSRVVTMAQIHEMLYQSSDYARVPFAKYARALTSRVLSASDAAAGNITLHFELEEVSLPVELAIPCGLILNELVANCLKHAFPTAAHGTIRIELRFAPEHSVLLSVSDNGIGISPELVLEHLGSLGVQLVMTLVEQLEGRLEIIRQPDSTFRITFPREVQA